jgi:hypothetical protein
MEKNDKKRERISANALCQVKSFGGGVHYLHS